MRETLETIMQLQPSWSASNTDEMKLRGYYVRTDGPDWLRDQIPALQALMPPAVDDLAAEGRDGTGLKTEVPWFRLFSTSRSERARFGFYIVYLFDKPGSAVYLSLNQGTTRWNGGDFKPLPTELLVSRVRWANGVLAGRSVGREELQGRMDLRADTPLANAYETGNIAAIEYRRGEVPSNEGLLNDLSRFARLLGFLYEAQDSGDVPGEPPAEIAVVLETVEGAAGRKAQRHPGFRPNAAQRRAIEMRAMHLATQHYQAGGWTVEDVSRTAPYDLKAVRQQEELHVEVKGTTSDGTEVLLTRGEVEHHRTSAPTSALAVVSSITVSGTPQAPTAVGGELRLYDPWTINQDDLVAVGFQYRVPPPLAERSGPRAVEAPAGIEARRLPK